jgi:hypothetical protein
MKKILFIALAAIFFASCNNAPDNKTAEAQEIIVISVDDFWSNPDEFVGKDIAVEGLVMHVCQHGGKRMFIAGADPDERLQIKTGDDIPAFAVELEGSMLEIKGYLDELRIDEDYLATWEAELIADNPESELKIHRGEEGHQHEEDDAEYEWKQISRYREMLSETEEDHLSFYSLIAKSYVEK